jgi:DNA-binding response OmpR family regulator
VTEQKPNLLIVEDDPDVAEMLDAYFKVQGYEVLTVYSGEEAVRSCRVRRPDILILDIRLPDIDGYEVARRLRTNQRTLDIPIIFLTEKRSRADRLQGLSLGAEDYITKPFDIQELRLRVRNALSRSVQGTLTNPVTLLPEGVLVDERLNECLSNSNWSLLLVGLENMVQFRESYGFVASDDVLRAVSLMIHNAVRDVGDANDFVGQYSPVEFILVTMPLSAGVLRERIRSRLDQSLDFFYPLKDRNREDFQARRIKVTIRQLDSSQGPFSDLSALKAALLCPG